MRLFQSLFLVLALLVCCVKAESKAYRLERRFGESADWNTVTEFMIVRNHEHSPARLRVTNTDAVELSKAQKDLLTTSSLIFYRVMTQEGSEEVVSMSTTPCGLIRGFEALDSTTVTLREKLKVTPGVGTAIVGLQLIPETNFFHSKMLNGDECDVTVVQKLFPTVTISSQLSLLQPTALMSTVRYKDLQDIEAANSAAQKGAKKQEVKKSIRKVKNEDGEWVEEEIVVEEKSFIQKYWMYFVIPLVLQIVQGLAKK